MWIYTSTRKNPFLYLLFHILHEGLLWSSQTALNCTHQMNAGAQAEFLNPGWNPSLHWPRLIFSSDWCRTWLFSLNQLVLLVRSCFITEVCVTHLQNDTEVSFGGGGIFLFKLILLKIVALVPISEALTRPSAWLWGMQHVLTRVLYCCIWPVGGVV